MKVFILRRLVRSAVVLFGVMTLAFVMIHIAPGDPARMYLGFTAPPSALRAERHLLGEDQSFIVQYGLYIGHVLTGNLGKSLFTGIPVITTLGQRAPITLELTLLTVILSTIVSLILGVLAAWRRASSVDGAVRTGTVIGISVPNFWLGLMLILIFGLYIPHVLPSNGWVDFTTDPAQNLYHAILPVFVLTLPVVAIVTRTLRVSMLDSLSTDYVLFARSMGLRERRVLRSIALPNALIPTTTVIGLSIGYLIGSAVIIEQLFTIPGIGSLAVNAFQEKDFPVAIGATLFIAFFFVAANFVVDILYAYLNPKVRDLYLNRSRLADA